MADACVTVPMGPACVNISGVRAGDRNEMSFTLTQGGTPIDLTGKTLAAQARVKVTDASPAVTAEVEITDALAGKGIIRWPGDEVRTSLGTKGSWTGVWDMQMSNGTGPDDAQTVVEGKFGAVLDVTRP